MASLSGAVAKETGRREFTVLYTAQERGQIRSCDCNKFRYGGLGRAAAYMRTVRELTPDLVVIEGGDFLAKDSPEGRLKADVFVQYVKMMRYAAVVPGEREAAFSAEYLRRLDKDAGGIFTCANMMEPGGRRPLFCPYVVKKLPGGLRVGVIGVVDPQLAAPVSKLPGVPVVTDPAGSLEQHLPDLRKECDVVVLVVHASGSLPEELAAKACPEIVFATHTSSRERPVAEGQTKVIKPVGSVAGSVFVESATQWAWSVGTLDLEVNGAKVTKSDNSIVYLGRAVEEDAEMVRVYDVFDAKSKQLAKERTLKLKEQVSKRLEARKLAKTGSGNGSPGSDRTPR